MYFHNVPFECSLTNWPLSSLTKSNTTVLFTYSEQKHSLLTEIFSNNYNITLGRDSAVGVTSHYGLDCPRFESRLGRVFPHPFRRALGSTQPPSRLVAGLSQGVRGPGRGVDHPPHLWPRLNKEYSYTSTPFLALVACSKVNFALL